MPRKRTQAEEDSILDNIEQVANDLSIQVNELQEFLSDLRQTRQKRPNPLRSISNEQEDQQYG